MGAIIENDFFAIIKPFHYFFCIFGHRKFNIHNNNISVIKVNSVIVMFVTDAFQLFLYLAAMLYTSFSTDFLFKMYSVSYLCYVIHFFVYSVVTYVLKNMNVELILRLQSIDRLLYDKNDTFKCKILSWVMCGVTFLFYLIFISIKLCVDNRWNPIRALFVSITLYPNIELAYYVFILVFLGLKLDRLIKVTSQIDFYDIDKEAIGKSKRILDLYNEIIDGINNTIKTSKLIILTHVVAMFFQTIIYVQGRIHSAKNGMDLNFSETKGQVHFFGILVWILKDLFVETALCLASEYVYQKIAILMTELRPNHSSSLLNYCIKNIRRSVKVKFHKLPGLHGGRQPSSSSWPSHYDLHYCFTAVCLHLIIAKKLPTSFTKTCDFPAKLKCNVKNAKRYLWVNFQKLEGCGVFTVDGALPLKMGSLVAYYTIVLLQFNFL
ncbi:uncharacterized protein LOC128679825 [Plodia interpunctella]|uniref:uncharacterized protein LOC128679825 n=1 Tax=Plodia interpunctella TaxID=58824 RepID=UPI002367E3D0|nr:uncharacterized protein LOC128679825 [Plodia interpunctella]